MTLAARDLSVELGGRTVLSGVTLTLEAAQVVAVVGPNGAGKSTMLRALAGLAVPASGIVTLGGEDMAAMSPDAIARRIAYVPQSRTLGWPVSVREVVTLGRLPHGTTSRRGRNVAEDNAAIDGALAQMDVQHLATRPATDLSGGELARVLLARALAQDTPIVIADEPTAGLDLAHVLELFAIFARLAAEGRLVVVALHDLSLALRFCHRTAFLAQGELLAAGRSEEVITAERVSGAFGVTARIASLDHVPIVLADRSLT
ncbi:MAG: ABC transporter ATP-binding protein [Hyphomicrobiaceae bacterium]